MALQLKKKRVDDGPVPVPKAVVELTDKRKKDGTFKKKPPTEHLRQYMWKKGQSGNPAGLAPGNGSIVKWLKKRLEGPSYNSPEKFVNLAHELSDVILRQAQRGNYNFIYLLLEKAESKQMTEDDLNSEIERFFNVVTKHVSDKAVCEAIARDLGLDNEGKPNVSSDRNDQPEV